jgi:hypothetical protein
LPSGLLRLWCCKPSNRVLIELFQEHVNKSKTQLCLSLQSFFITV